MKFTTTQKALNSALSLVNRAVASRPTHPILANVKLQAEGDRVTLEAFDNSLGIRTSFEAEIAENGVTTLPASLLSAIVSKLEGSLTLSDGKEENLYQIKSKSGTYKIRGMAAEEFPELPLVESTGILLNPETLSDALKHTLFSASADETKQVLTGCNIKIDSNFDIEVAATDGHRLSVFGSIDGDPLDECTIPAKALAEIQRLLASTDDVSVKVDPGQITFETTSGVITSRLLEGQYPNYRQLIPTQFQRQLNLDRRSFLQSLERISVLADQKNNVVKLSLDDTNQELILSVDAQDVGSGRESLPAQISGDAMDIAFNVKYLLDVLKVVSTTEVMLQMNGATNPVTVTPIGGAEFTGLLMPVQIRD